MQTTAALGDVAPTGAAATGVPMSNLKHGYLTRASKRTNCAWSSSFSSIMSAVVFDLVWYGDVRVAV